MLIKDYAKISKDSGLYQIVNLKISKLYIGSAINLKRRIHKHYYELKTENHNNELLLQDFKKYGESNFEVIVFIMKLSYEELLEKEKELIINLNVVTNGYNKITDHSSFFIELNKSKEHIENNKKKCQKKVFGFNRFTGEKNYTCESLTEAAKLINDQTTNISSCCNGKLNYVKDIIWIYEKDFNPNKKYIFKEHAAKNRKFSKEHREKIRQNTIKNRGRIVYMYSKDLKLIKEYNTIREAELENNINKDMLRYKLDKNKLHLGYFWKTSKL